MAILAGNHRQRELLTGSVILYGILSATSAASDLAQESEMEHRERITVYCSVIAGCLSGYLAIA